MDSIPSSLPSVSVRTESPEVDPLSPDASPGTMISAIFSNISHANPDTLCSLALVSHQILEQVGVSALKSFFLTAEQAFASMSAVKKLELISNLSTWLVNIDGKMPASDLANFWGRLQVMSGPGCLTLFEELDSLKSIMVSLRQSRFSRTSEGMTVHKQFDQAIRISSTNISILMEDSALFRLGS